MTQSELGAALGISFQQVQKYERGTNRVSSARLLRIAGILKVDVVTVLDGANGVQKFPSAGPSPIDLIAEPQSLRLATIFASIEDPELRRLLLAITDRVANLDQRARKRT